MVEPAVQAVADPGPLQRWENDEEIRSEMEKVGGSWVWIVEQEPEKAGVGWKVFGVTRYPS